MVFGLPSLEKRYLVFPVGEPRVPSHRSLSVPLPLRIVFSSYTPRKDGTVDQEETFSLVKWSRKVSGIR